jgi:hypothetical protein
LRLLRDGNQLDELRRQLPRELEERDHVLALNFLVRRAGRGGNRDPEAEFGAFVRHRKFLGGMKAFGHPE